MTTISKDHYYTYPQYHTSLDDLTLVNGSQIEETLGIYLKVINKIEKLQLFRSMVTNCEVMLSKHNLYPKIGGGQRPNAGKNKLDIII